MDAAPALQAKLVVSIAGFRLETEMAQKRKLLVGRYPCPSKIRFHEQHRNPFQVFA